MQNIGFAYAILPGLKKLYSTAPSVPAGKYLGFFNTHPYLAPTVAGVFLKLEEQGDDGTVEKLKPAISGSLAALGDTFFWATLKPIVGLLLLLTVLADQVWGMILVLLFYNSLHLWVMSWGFTMGYRNGPGGALELGRFLSVDRTRHIALMIPLLAGMVLAGLSPGIPGAGWGIGPGLLIFFVAAFAFRLRLGVLWIFYGVFTLSLIWTIIK